jgi:hypothetical protein
VNTTPPAAAVVCHVRRLLDTIGDALVESRIDPLLTAEQDLEDALRALAAFHATELDATGRAAIRDEVQRCRAALERCRRLGAARECFTALVLEGTGRLATYTRAGEAPTGLPTRTLQARG